jgi:hypothetical protein
MAQEESTCCCMCFTTISNEEQAVLGHCITRELVKYNIYIYILKNNILIIIYFII